MSPDLESDTGDGWQPAIREVVTDHEALGRVYFERDDDMELELCDAFGLFFLDVETGSVEGWTWPLPPLPSPSNRFVYFPSEATPVLYDRLAGKSYTWDARELSVVLEYPAWWARYPESPHGWGTDLLSRPASLEDWHRNSLLGWGASAEERLVFAAVSRYAVVDGSMEAIAWFELDPGIVPGSWVPHPAGAHLVMLSVLDISEYSTTYGPEYRIDLSSGTWKEVSSDEARAAPRDWGLSPDGRMQAVLVLDRPEEPWDIGGWAALTVVSLVDTFADEELMRVKGASHPRWLADSSALLLDTCCDARIVNVDGSVEAALPVYHSSWTTAVPAPDDPDRINAPDKGYLSYCREPAAEGTTWCRVLTARIVDRGGGELVSARLRLHIPPGSAWDFPEGSIEAVAFNRSAWASTSDELRMPLTLGGPYTDFFYYPALALAVDLPPFTALTALEVAGGKPCTHLREAPDSDAPSLVCLPDGAVVDSVSPPEGTTYGDNYPAGYIAGGFAHVRTEDGVEGWLPLSRLLWPE